MDRDGYAQLNRIEETVNHLVEGQKMIMNLDAIDVLTEFYDNEIKNPEGELHYLVKDEKLKGFFENLIMEEEGEQEPEQEETSGMTSKPFK